MTKLAEKQESLLSELFKDVNRGDPEAIQAQEGLMNEIRKRMVEAMLDGEMTSHLGYEPHDPAGNGPGNSRNGYSTKKVQSKDGELDLDVPRDRNGNFEPRVVKKGQRRIDGIDNVIIALYARGLTRGIQAELKELYGSDVSPTLISNVTNSVLGWRSPDPSEIDVNFSKADMFPTPTTIQAVEYDRSDGYISDLYPGMYPILFPASSNISALEF